MDIEVICDNILTAKEDIIVHQGNSSWGDDEWIKRKYPEVYDKYKIACSTIEPENLLGKIQLIKTYDGKIVCNLFGQLNYGRNKVQTDYEAITICFDKIYKYAKLNNLTVAIPYNIGCGLAGGKWTRVLNIILKRFKDKSIVKLYRL